MNQDFANHFLALLSCILKEIYLLTQIKLRTHDLYQIAFHHQSANFLFFHFHVCKQFIWAFLLLQTIFFRIFDPPPSKEKKARP